MITRSLVSTFEALLVGSSRTRPSRLPKMLWPTQLMTLRLRWANIGASTVFIRVSPVLPSLPASSDPVELGQLCDCWDRGTQAGGEIDVAMPCLDGGKRVMRAGREEFVPTLVQSGFEQLPVPVISPRGNGGSVLATFRTIRWSIDSGRRTPRCRRR